MDLLSLLTTAQVRTLDGEIVGEVFGVHITGGKLYLTVDVDESYEDPDDGAKDEIPDDDASVAPQVTPLHAVGTLEEARG